MLFRSSKHARRTACSVLHLHDRAATKPNLPLKESDRPQRHQQIGSMRDVAARLPARRSLNDVRAFFFASFLGFSEPFISPPTLPLARTNEDLTRHGDESPALAAAHRAAGKRRRCRDLVAAVATMVGRPCAPSSRAHPSRVADRTPRTPTPSRSSPTATRNRSRSRPKAFLMMVSLP